MKAHECHSPDRTHAAVNTRLRAARKTDMVYASDNRK